MYVSVTRRYELFVSSVSMRKFITPERTIVSSESLARLCFCLVYTTVIEFYILMKFSTVQ